MIDLANYVTPQGYVVTDAMGEALPFLPAEERAVTFDELVRDGYITERDDELVITLPGFAPAAFARRLRHRDYALLHMLRTVDDGSWDIPKVLLMLAVYSLMDDSDDPMFEATDDELDQQCRLILRGEVEFPPGPASRVLHWLQDHLQAQYPKE